MFYLLEEYEDELLWSGDIFRVFIQNKGENYYTDVDRPLGLLSISGYKAGKIALIFPKEAFKKDAIYSLDKN